MKQLKKAWIPMKSVISVRVLRNCFLKLANAISYLNKVFDKFWLIDTMQLMVTTVSTLANLAISDEIFNKNNLLGFIIAALSIVRLLLLSIFCGDMSAEVYPSF